MEKTPTDRVPLSDEIDDSLFRQFAQRSGSRILLAKYKKGTSGNWKKPRVPKNIDGVPVRTVLVHTASVGDTKLSPYRARVPVSLQNGEVYNTFIENAVTFSIANIGLTEDGTIVSRSVCFDRFRPGRGRYEAPTTKIITKTRDQEWSWTSNGLDWRDRGFTLPCAIRRAIRPSEEQSPRVGICDPRECHNAFIPPRWYDGTEAFVKVLIPLCKESWRNTKTFRNIKRDYDNGCYIVGIDMDGPSDISRDLLHHTYGPFCDFNSATYTWFLENATLQPQLPRDVTLPMCSTLASMLYGLEPEDCVGDFAQ